MQKLAMVVITFGLVLGGAGCGKKDEKKGDEAAKKSPESKALDELKALKDEACKCKDAACATKVNESFAKFMEKHEDTKGDEKQAEKAGAIASEMSDCLAKATGAP